MKEHYPHFSVKQLCTLFGKSRHAYYDQLWRKGDNLLKDDIVLQLVHQIRSELPRLGTRKLQHMLSNKLDEHRLQVGRDYLFDLLCRNKLLVRTRRRKAITTDSRHWMRKYSNLTTHIEVLRPEQLWVSDITYIRLTHEFAYLSLITDAYSHKIMGFSLRKDLSSQGCLDALKMALDNRLYKHLPLIHHSDRGSQYCCKDYVQLLSDHNIAISMTENGDPYENAIAERLNGILKTEFNLYTSLAGFDDAQRRVAKSINSYNDIRPHDSCDRLTPKEAHFKNGKLIKRWKLKKHPV
jgi:putative transposase